ncbi:MAG: phosphoribosylformylglycinamidine cyclo-ligase [Candidatus Dormibacteria bacterium]
MGDLRYADAGVDIAEGTRAVALIKRSVASTHTAAVVGPVGAFSGLFDFGPTRYRHPLIASSTDSVGTKVKVATAVGRHRGIGIDLVNHCINDILCCGARPLFFLDYYATGRLQPEHLAEIIDGAAEACRTASCAIIGGETAEMPGVYGLGDYDIAGFIVGAVERDELIDGSRIEVGDAVLGLPSSGLHTNGYSLVRHIVLEHDLDWSDVLPGTDRDLGTLLLEPHRSYLDAVQQLRSRVDVRGLAHITGGGLLENIPRVLPGGMGAEIDRSAWTVPDLFAAIESTGGVHAEEMWRTFNMGIGMVVIVPSAEAAGVSAASGMEVRRIGTVVSGPPGSPPGRVVLR